MRLLPKAECLNETLFRDIAHSRAAIASSVHDYNTVRPHSALGYTTPAAFNAAFRSHRAAAPELLEGSARPAVASLAQMGKVRQARTHTSLHAKPRIFGWRHRGSWATPCLGTPI